MRILCNVCTCFVAIAPVCRYQKNILIIRGSSVILPLSAPWHLFSGLILCPLQSFLQNLTQLIGAIWLADKTGNFIHINP